MPSYMTPDDEEKAKAAAQQKYLSGMQTQPMSSIRPDTGRPPGPMPPTTDGTGEYGRSTRPPVPMPPTDDRYVPPGGTGGGNEPPVGPPPSGRPGPVLGGPPIPGGRPGPVLLGPPVAGGRPGPTFGGGPTTGGRPGPTLIGPPAGGPPPFYKPRWRPPTRQFGTRFGMR